MSFRAVESQHRVTAGHCALTYLGYPVGLLRGKLGSGQQWVRGSIMKCEVPHQCESSSLWLLAGSKEAFQVQVKANGLWAVSLAR